MNITNGFWKGLQYKFGTNVMRPCICVLKTDRAHCSFLKTAVLSCITGLDFGLKWEACIMTGSNKAYLYLQPLLYVFYFRIDWRCMSGWYIKKSSWRMLMYLSKQILINLGLHMASGLVTRKLQNEIRNCRWSCNLSAWTCIPVL